MKPISISACHASSGEYHRETGGEMETVITPQAIAPGQIGRAADQWFGHVLYLPGGLLDVEFPVQGGEQRVVLADQAAFYKVGDDILDRDPHLSWQATRSEP
ncbi:MAG: hypothetical protein HYX63_19905 [Gammaproteobacteria bacterium]|nr:hypothetical protein [Gammaproteobacteria bacterium]